MCYSKVLYNHTKLDFVISHKSFRKSIQRYPCLSEYIIICIKDNQMQITFYYTLHLFGIPQCRDYTV